MKSLRRASLILVVLLALLPYAALAQTYSFALPEQTVNYYINEDGTASVEYVFVFENDPSASPIDYVDVGLPNPNFDEGSITADVNGQPITDISSSGYQGQGNAGVALGLGSRAIRPGQTGTVRMFLGRLNRVLFTDSSDANYASTNFSPTYFGSQYVHGASTLTVTFHLPPGVKPEEPRWHSAPSGFPEQPETGLDEQGRVTYTWTNANASPDRRYEFGASFPKTYVPAGAIARPSFSESVEETTGINPGDLLGFAFCFGFAAFIGLIIFGAFRSTQKRKLQYLPPKIAIEGHGIKRGLTAVEAAILLEQPMDKIMTMILFGGLKKGAAQVVTRDPLKLEVTQPLPEGLQPYEVEFLQAFQTDGPAVRRRALQDMMVDLVKSVSNKMKGFSRRETVAYYRDITDRAWTQVEAAGTPEVKSEKYNEVMEWTMLDKNYGDRTQEVFRGGPVYVPVWWPRYDPTFGGGGGTRPASTGAPSTSGGGGGFATPQLPGAAFAASVVQGAQNFAGGVVGNITDFTSSITNRTNPVPVTTTTRSGGGGRSGGGCACACACAGCACACAGGGR